VVLTGFRGRRQRGCLDGEEQPSAVMEFRGGADRSREERTWWRKWNQWRSGEALIPLYRWGQWEVSRPVTGKWLPLKVTAFGRRGINTAGL
jgi:hypothetical protein